MNTKFTELTATLKRLPDHEMESAIMKLAENDPIFFKEFSEYLLTNHFTYVESKPRED